MPRISPATRQAAEASQAAQQLRGNVVQRGGGISTIMGVQQEKQSSGGGRGPG